MAYKLKSNKVIIDGQETILTPGTLPISPSNGMYAIDSSDGKLKVYNQAKARWIILGDAEDVVFDNSSNGFTSNNVQDAIEEINAKVEKKFFCQYQIIGTLNYTQYVYSFKDAGGDRSGDISNGYRHNNSAPIICPFNGTLKKGVFAIKGVAVSTGSISSNVTVNFELWKVGFQNQGIKLGDIDITIDSSVYDIGNWWDTSEDTNFTGSNNYNISVAEGDLLALKFIRVQNSSNAVAIKNLTVVFEIEEN